MNDLRRTLLQGIVAAMLGTAITACGASVVATNPNASHSVRPSAVASPATSAPAAGEPAATSVVPTPTSVEVQPQNPILSFSPQAGGPGTVVQLSGSGYAPNVPVVIRLGTPQPVGEVLATATSDLAGRWQASFTMPDRLPSGDPIPAAHLRLVAMNDHNQALASAPFSYTPPASPTDPTPVVTLEGASQAVRDLLQAYVSQQDARPYLASNLQIRLDAGTPIDQLLNLRQDTLRTFTVQAPDLSRPSEVLFVPATLTYESGDVAQMFTLVVNNGVWVINGSSMQ